MIAGVPPALGFPLELDLLPVRAQPRLPIEVKNKATIAAERSPDEIAGTDPTANSDLFKRAKLEGPVMTKKIVRRQED